MNHLNNHAHAFIKNGHIDDIFVFDEDKHNDSFISEIANTIGADQGVCLCNYFDRTGIEPQKYWLWDGAEFTAPTQEYLLSIGVIEEMPVLELPTLNESPTDSAVNP